MDETSLIVKRSLFYDKEKTWKPLSTPQILTILEDAIVHPCPSASAL